jgi:gamma-glutamyltranspeptidase / glutathione hydrolase
MKHLTVIAAIIAYSGTTLAQVPGGVTPPTAAGGFGVATDHELATKAAEAMLQRGGNAVDAAVAASFTLSVVRPFACGIGGGGFMVIYLPGTAGVIQTAVNYRETCPAAIKADTFSEPGLPARASEFGGLAVATPGTVKGLLYVLEKYGTLPRDVVLAPAIAAAEDGFVADAAYIRSKTELLEQFSPASDGREKFGFVWTTLLGKGELEIGDRIRNPGHGKALRLIASEGADVFYRGEIATAIVSSVQRTGGRLSREDLALYKVSETPPLLGSAFGRTVLTMPPPSSGGVALLQILGMMERSSIKPQELKSSDPAYLFSLVEAMKFAFADRAFYMADPAFVPVPTERLLSAAYIDSRMKIMPKGRTEGIGYYTINENGEQLVPDGGTSHISVVDSRGGAVACTETINLAFGSLVDAEGFGFILNNQMDDFTTSAAPNAFGLTQSKRNAPDAGKRPLSSMTPTVVLRSGSVEMVSGGAGGPRIISGTVQTVLNRLIFDMPAGECVASPRVHHQWKPSELQVEDRLMKRYNGLPVSQWLEKFGHRVKRTPAVAGVNVVVVSQDTVEAAADDRRGGVATPHSRRNQEAQPPKELK